MDCLKVVLERRDLIASLVLQNAANGTPNERLSGGYAELCYLVQVMTTPVAIDVPSEETIPATEG